MLYSCIMLLFALGNAVEAKRDAILFIYGPNALSTVETVQRMARMKLMYYIFLFCTYTLIAFFVFKVNGWSAIAYVPALVANRRIFYTETFNLSTHRGWWYLPAEWPTSWLKGILGKNASFYLFIICLATIILCFFI